jgi:hypothetical protein
MKTHQVRTFEDIEKYLREFGYDHGMPHNYDFVGALHLFLTILDNLVQNYIDKNIEDLEESCPLITDRQLAFLKKLEHLA